MRIAICDDEERCCLQIREQIERIYHSLDIVIDTYQNGNDLLKHFKLHPQDVVFLDIEMPVLDGLSLAEKLRDLSQDVILVFLTGHIEYALRGYEVNALRYLTKPVDQGKLAEVLNYIVEREKNRHFLWLKTAAGEERVEVSEIFYLEAQNQNIMVCAEQQTYIVRYNMGDYEEELRKYGFFRIHRSYLVALGKIKGIARHEVILEGDVHLPVSRSRERALKEALYQFIQQEAM